MTDDERAQELIGWLVESGNALSELECECIAAELHAARNEGMERAAQIAERHDQIIAVPFTFAASEIATAIRAAMTEE